MEDTNQADLTFEDALKQLEEIVRELETDEYGLEESLKKFELGIKLSKYCSEKLEQSEKRISILLKDHSGAFLEKPFEAEEE
jgi:exodeoxyribonuclease VII small subunit